MDTLCDIARLAGLDPAPLLDHMTTDAVDAIYAANTAEVVERGFFGSPTYVVDGDVIYGQDHLGIVERALKKPFTVRIPD